MLRQQFSTFFVGGGGGVNKCLRQKNFRSQTFFEEIYFGLLIKKIIFEWGGGIFFSGGRKNVNKICIKFLFPILIQI